MTRVTAIGRLRRRASEVDRWRGLFLLFRLACVGVAVGVLALQGFTGRDALLAWAAIGYAVLTVGVVLGRPAVLLHPGAWACDVAIGLGLVVASGDWRGPLFLLALTAVAPPASVLPFRRALAFGAAFAVAFVGVALATGLDRTDVESEVGVEILATRLALLGLLTIGLAYAAETLRRLDDERRRAHRLALEAERRRIAWELHDSAKQRLHAAHLVLSAQPPSEPLELVLDQLRGATADMETSLAELHFPLEDRDLATALREHAAELATLTGAAPTRVEGSVPALEPVVATHAYRILAEAMTNAVRHAHAQAVHVRLGSRPDGGLVATVTDDGRGLPSAVRPGAQGLHGMHSRAFAIGGRLQIGACHRGAGTCVSLEIPVTHEEITA